LIERILHNLLSNAVAFTRTGGVVVGCRRRSAELRIEVWDSGPGIALFDQPEIFREFPQLKAAPPKERQGTGLGLAIVARLVRLLGLRIKFRSAVGKGSMFAVILPSAAQSMEWLEPRRNLEDRRPPIQP
jgi:signal transduction histidine kinase